LYDRNHLQYGIRKIWGISNSKNSGKTNPNRRQLKIVNIGKQLRQLKKQWKQTAEHEKEGIAELRSILREKLLALRKAESTNKMKKERSNKGHHLLAIPSRC
jgi:hypothetical protein